MLNHLEATLSVAAILARVPMSLYYLELHRQLVSLPQNYVAFHSQFVDLHSGYCMIRC